MGNLTDDLTRLRAEITTLRDHRNALRTALTQNILQLKGDVAELRSGFRQAHADMANSGRNSRATFVSDLSQQVAGLLGAVATDLKGAREAWIESSVTLSSGLNRRHVIESIVGQNPLVSEECAAKLASDASITTDVPPNSHNTAGSKATKSAAGGSGKKKRQSFAKK